MKRLVAWTIDRWKVTVPVGIVAVGGAAWLFFGVFGFHLIFVDEKVEEAAPVFVAATSPAGVPGDAFTQGPADDTAGTTAAVVEEISEPVVEVQPQTLAAGSFIDRSHPTVGTAVVLGDGSGQRFLRFEDFETDNGPDLDVYLVAADPDAPVDQLGADFVNLGDLKGNVGSQNYEIPPEVDLATYRTVVIWCVRFSVAFGAAPLVP